MLNLLYFILIPFIAILFACILPKKSVKSFAFLYSLIPLCILIAHNTSLLGADTSYAWMQALSIHFHLHIDSLSLVFLFLVNFIIPISILAETSLSRFFYVLILALQGILNGFFTAQDLAVFTFFWEAMLVPLFFMINLWGGKERQKASYTFIIYMVAGSILMVAAVLALYLSCHTFDITKLSLIAEKAPYASFICAIFLLAFCVKTPLFPFHGWLPISYCEASTTGTILLSAILSKAGIYGIIRILQAFFPTIMSAWSFWLLDLAIIGVLYGAFCAWAQNDFKKLIAYSSFSHINFVLAGLFIWDVTSQQGAIIQAINHAVTITGLFLLAGWLESRLNTTLQTSASGLAAYMPKLCWMTLFFVLSSVALPGLNNFVGEVLILYGAFGKSIWYALLLGLTVILSVLYMLRFMHSIYFERPSNIKQSYFDIQPKEALLLVPLIVLILWLGLYPMPVLKQIEPITIAITELTK